MKTIEEKAKAYDKARERAEKVLKTQYTAHWDKHKELIEHLFPELAVSEDGRIRKAIGYAIGQSTHSDGTLINGVSSEEALAWLEKQCEHTNFYNKIQIGDKVTRNEDGVLVNLSQLNRVEKPSEKQGEQKPYVSKTMNEKRDFDSGFTRMMENEQKPWSEEDEAWLNDIINYAEQGAKLDSQQIDWLKSLRPQNKYAYNPYKAVVESIAEMCEKYASPTSDLSDFLNNIRVKCKDAKEYDSMFPQKQWKPRKLKD